VVFVGHSVSAMIGVLACRRAPELFRALAMIGPSPCYLDDGDYRGGFSRADIEGLLAMLDANHRTWAAAMAPQIMGNLDRPALADELQESFCRMDPVAARGFARATFTADNRADLAAVRIPTLIMQCSADAIAGPEVGAFVHARIPGSTLVQLAATGHCPNLSAPDEVIAVLDRWLGTLDA
jgi:sigma-B regulation protein RsbQ